MRKGLGYIPVILIAVGVMTLAAASFFIIALSQPSVRTEISRLINNLNTSQNVNRIEKVITNTNAQNTNQAPPVAGEQKTYTNTVLGYSVQYPATWKVSTCDDGPVWFGTTGVACGTDMQTTDIIVTRLDANTDLEAALTQEGKNIMVDPKQTSISVAGIPSTRLTGTTKKDDGEYLGGGLFRDAVFVPHNGVYFRISYFSSTGKPTQESEFIDFLSTFSFLE